MSEDFLKNTAVKTEKNDCGNCALWEETDLLKAENYELKSEIRKLSAEVAAYKSTEEKSAKRLLAADMEADRLNKAALYKYNTELKALKLYADKFRAVYNSGSDGQKLAITDLLTDFLKDIDKENFFSCSKEKMESLAEKAGFDKNESAEAQEFYGDDSTFNLEEALNPPEDLDLSALLNELGITGGGN